MNSEIKIGELAHSSKGAFKIGPFGSSLKKEDLSNEGIPVAGIENVLPNQFVSKFRRFVSEKKFAELSDYKIEPDDILISTMGTIGRAAIAPPNIETAIIDSHLFRMRLDKNRVFPPYLCYAINGYQGLKRQLKQMARGAIMDGLNTTILKECSIPLFKLDEQKRIAAILDKADRLRRQRRFAQTLSDSFLQSVFIKMFDEHLSKDFPTTELIDLVTITGGGTPSRDVPEYFTGKIAWLTSKDMRGDYIFDTEEHITEKAIKDSATKLVSKGSILMVVKSKVLMNRLPLAISETPLCHGQDIKSIQCSKEVNSLFLLYVLKYNERKLLQLARGANTEGLTLPMIESVPVPNVPLSLQEKFAEIVKNFERVRRQQREATRQAEHLFQTLLHRAFRGEL